MTRRTMILIGMLTMAPAATLLAGGPSTDTAVPPDSPVAEVPVPGKTVPKIERKNLTPMHQEIYDAMEAERARIEDLDARFARAVLPADRVLIQREIEQIKKAGQLNVLEIQLRYAQQAGRTETVRQLEANIEILKNPQKLAGNGPTVLEKALNGGGK